jgi:hypothetical protein
VRCGDVLEPDMSRCETCGTPTGRDAADQVMATAFLDTVQLGPPPGQIELEDERIVRPSLAILFRMAVGPAADYYAPRFLEYERVSRSFPSWNWAAPWFPTVWAFYHKLWVAGLAFALWPVAAMEIFGLLDPYLGDSTFAAFACALLLLWVLPGLVAGVVANTLLYHKARELVRDAEAETARPDEAARLLGERVPIAVGSALLLGIVAIMSSVMVVAPVLQTAVADRVVRTRVAEALAALRPLQHQIEGGWDVAKLSLIAPNYAHIGQLGTDFLAAVNVSLESGRVRVALGPLIPQLTGRSILLAPALDRDERVRWICVPIDIPARYLPHECREG